MVQYIVLRRDLWRELGWPLGPVVAQGCHAAVAALWEHREDKDTQEYVAAGNIDSMHKVWDSLLSLPSSIFWEQQPILRGGAACFPLADNNAKTLSA